jgi:hypothetical protein
LEKPIGLKKLPSIFTYFQIGFGFIFAIMLFFICFELFVHKDSTVSKVSSPVVTSSKPALQVLDYGACDGDYGSKMICGTVVNNSDFVKSYAQVEINLYDKYGNFVGSTLDNITNFQPHSKWRFRAPISEDSTKTFIVKSVNGY